MTMLLKTGQTIDPSGFGLAVVNIPSLDPETNISLVDTSYLWSENVTSADRSTISSYVGIDGYMPETTITNFLITNSTTYSRGDLTPMPLYYRHRCRFHHYAYNQPPEKQIYITDQYGNILKDINYRVVSSWVSSNVYSIDIHTSFTNNQLTQYLVKYNRCLSNGTQLYPGWSEILNAEMIFHNGDPTINEDEYTMAGPDSNGLYTIIVPPVPTISPLINSVGISFENAPTIVSQDVTNNVASYSDGVVVRYALKATGTTTYTIQRNYTRSGVPDTNYLQSSSTDTWGASPFNFTIGDEVLGLCGISVFVNSDNYLITGDEAYFDASKSLYFMTPTSYSAMYLKKPEHVTNTDDWNMKVKAGVFRRRMDTSGNVVASGSPSSTLFEYSLPEYLFQIWDTAWGTSYRRVYYERAEMIDQKTIQLKNAPLYVDPDTVFDNAEAPGFPPSGIMYININDEQLDPSEILDWDNYNATVKVSRILDMRDSIAASYVYREDFYTYTGFRGSGGVEPIDQLIDFQPLDLNPTPPHNYAMYLSGDVAHIFVRPYSTIEENTGQATMINQDTLYHNYTGTPASVYDLDLGSVSVGPNCKITDLEITDVRTRGGGLSRLGIIDLDRVKDTQPESEFFWDVGYFDGQAVPANGVIVVSIPKAVLNTYGGPFDQSEVRQKVMKHMALGEYPIIQYT
jgi:hypothetical protein